jgi:hypothetical protein
VKRDEKARLYPDRIARRDSDYRYLGGYPLPGFQPGEGASAQVRLLKQCEADRFGNPDVLPGLG